MAKKKIVGIPHCFNDGTYFLDIPYVKFAEEVMEGEVKLILYPEEVKGCDEILLVGGRDIDPTLFNEENYASRKVNTEMDKFHLDCIDVAIENGKSIFGICRGFQLLYYKFLNSRFKDSMYYEQHLQGHNQWENEVKRSSLSHRVEGRNSSFFVNSMHHQAVIAVEEFRPPFISYTSSLSAPKGCVVVEGITFIVNSSLVVGVQWHPEELKITPEEYSRYSDGATHLPD